MHIRTLALTAAVATAGLGVFGATVAPARADTTITLHSGDVFTSTGRGAICQVSDTGVWCYQSGDALFAGMTDAKVKEVCRDFALQGIDLRGRPASWTWICGTGVPIDPNHSNAWAARYSVPIDTAINAPVVPNGRRIDAGTVACETKSSGALDCWSTSDPATGLRATATSIFRHAGPTTAPSTSTNPPTGSSTSTSTHTATSTGTSTGPVVVTDGPAPTGSNDWALAGAAVGLVGLGVGGGMLLGRLRSR